MIYEPVPQNDGKIELYLTPIFSGFPGAYVKIMCFLTPILAKTTLTCIPQALPEKPKNGPFGKKRGGGCSEKSVGVRSGGGHFLLNATEYLCTCACVLKNLKKIRLLVLVQHKYLPVQ